MKMEKWKIVKNALPIARNGKLLWSILIITNIQLLFLYSISSDECHVCEEGLNRKLDSFSNECVCKPGFKENENGVC